jgi:hypothetical protein
MPLGHCVLAYKWYSHATIKHGQSVLLNEDQSLDASDHPPEQLLYVYHLFIITDLRLFGQVVSHLWVEAQLT